MSSFEVYDPAAIKAYHEAIKANDNPQWAVIDRFQDAKLNRNANLEAILQESENANLPSISVGATQARLLGLQAYAVGATSILEVGTLGGSTAAWLATLNPGAEVVTVEGNPEFAAVARRNLAKAGLSGRVEVLEGLGADVLGRLVEQVEAGTRPRFGFAFIDADKANNYTYLDQFIRMASPRALAVIDNMVPRSMGLDGNGGNEGQSNVNVETLEKLGQDQRVESVLVQNVGAKGWDGAVFAVLK